MGGRYSPTRQQLDAGGPDNAAVRRESAHVHVWESVETLSLRAVETSLTIRKQASQPGVFKRCLGCGCPLFRLPHTKSASNPLQR